MTKTKNKSNLARIVLQRAVAKVLQNKMILNQRAVFFANGKTITRKLSAKFAKNVQIKVLDNQEFEEKLIKAINLRQQ